LSTISVGPTIVGQFEVSLERSCHGDQRGVCFMKIRLLRYETVRAAVRRRSGRLRPAVDAGMTTAEYAVGTVAAVAFASVLFKVVQSAQVRAALSHIVTSALNVSL